MQIKLAFHCHHGELVEPVYDYQKRVDYIKQYKPKDEQELRLKLFRLIPEDRIPGQDSVEWEASNKAWEASNKAREASNYGKLFIKAWGVYILKYQAQLEALHKELCPDCPWDGKTIFTRRNKSGEWY